jgi:uncharacterized protein (DUF952 family)
MKKFIYKICSKFEWSNFQKKKIFHGTKKDIADGYIHFSDKNQVKSTLKRYFFGQDKLILLKVDTSKLENLIWEKSAGSKIFPHLYSYLLLKSVKKIYKIRLKKNGLHFFSSNY